MWRWDQAEPFGVNAPDENPSGLGAFDLPLRLPGQYFDKETNLHYNYLRDYDPSIGRYGESDPIGLRGGLNTYAYVAADPLRHIDLFGEQRLKPFPSPFLNELRKQLPEFLIEQGANTATTPQGKSICELLFNQCIKGAEVCPPPITQVGRAFCLAAYIVCITISGGGGSGGDPAGAP